MSEVASALGLPVTFEMGARSWKVAPACFEVEGLFTVWLEENALRAILRHEQALGPAGVAVQTDAWRRECAAGVYDWEGYVSYQAQRGAEGRKRLAALQLCKGGLPLDDALNVAEEAFADERTRALLVAACERATQDPNRPRRFRPAAGG